MQIRSDRTKKNWNGGEIENWCVTEQRKVHLKILHISESALTNKLHSASLPSKQYHYPRPSFKHCSIIQIHFSNIVTLSFKQHSIIICWVLFNVNVNTIFCQHCTGKRITEGLLRLDISYVKDLGNYWKYAARNFPAKKRQISGFHNLRRFF